jgi:tRNA(fMet)-specific endonuclease VapC
MLILDTDLVTLFQWEESREAVRLRERLAAVTPEEPCTTIVTFEEQTRGWLAYAKQANDLEGQIRAYRRLQDHLENYRIISVVGFERLAAVEYRRLLRLRIRIGTMDMKIAAIALVNDAILLSRNLQHFRKVPGLRVEDWSS